MKTWFTADTHFGHNKIIEYCNRPFSSIEEHDATIVDNWNSRVGKKDMVFHLGDFGFYQTNEQLEKLGRSLNGRIHLILGNHDKPGKMKHVPFAWIKDVYFLKTHTIGGFSQGIFLSHYGHRVWPKSGRSSFHLFGHSHTKLPPHGLSFDVGVDNFNYYPVELEEVNEKMKEQKIFLEFDAESDIVAE